MNHYERLIQARVADRLPVMNCERWEELRSDLAQLMAEQIAGVANGAQRDMLQMELRHNEELDRLKTSLMDDRLTDPCTVTPRPDSSPF